MFAYQNLHIPAHPLQDLLDYYRLETAPSIAARVRTPEDPNYPVNTWSYIASEVSYSTNHVARRSFRYVMRGSPVFCRSWRFSKRVDSSNYGLRGTACSPAIPLYALCRRYRIGQLGRRLKPFCTTVSVRRLLLR